MKNKWEKNLDLLTPKQLARYDDSLEVLRLLRSSTSFYTSSKMVGISPTTAKKFLGSSITKKNNKIVANAVSYGIFVEITQEDETEPIQIDVYGRECFQEQKTKSEKPGYMFNPIIAIAITSASRLLLSITEILLSKHDAVHAYCDTDSMMIPPKYTQEVQEFFQPLNPYDFNADIFKLERSNVWFYGISAKRYCLYSFENGTVTINDDDYSAHGLGHLMDPSKNAPDDKSDWQKQIWYDILDYHYNDIVIGPKYEEKYALQQISLSKPSIWLRFSKFNKGKPYSEQIKPFNFVLVGFGNVKENGELIKPLAPYQNPAKHAVYDDFIDCNTKTGILLRGQEYWKHLSDTILEYLRHPESKFDGDIGILRTKEIVVSSIVHIGKESDKLDDNLGLDSDSYVLYENRDEIERKFREIAYRILELKPKDVKEFGFSKQTLWNIKQKISINQLTKISTKMKIKLIQLVFKTYS